MEIFSLYPETFGLDISELSFKICKLKKRRESLRIEVLANFPLEEGVIENCEIKNEEKMISALRSALKTLKLRTKEVVASLPEEKSFLQVIKMPIMTEEDLRSAIVFEAEKYVPLPIDQVYLDCQIIGSSNEKSFDVLLAAVPKNISDSYATVLEKAGLKPVAFEIESQAIVRALIKDGFSSEALLIVDLGAIRTSFIIFSRKSISFTSCLPFSSHHLTEIIAKNLNISLEEAEKLKLKYGLEEVLASKFEDEDEKTRKIREEIFEALIPALVDLAQQIKKHLEYYESLAAEGDLLPEERKIKKIVLCGGGSVLKGLREFLEMEVKIPVEIGNPLVNLGEKQKPNISFEDSLIFTTAIGLALRTIK